MLIIDYLVPGGWRTNGAVRVLVLLAAFVLGSLLLTGGCGGGDSDGGAGGGDSDGEVKAESRKWDIEIDKDGRIKLDPKPGPRQVQNAIKVREGDAVTLNIESEEVGVFRIRGYEIAEQVGPVTVTTTQFTSNLRGKFLITFSSGGTAGEGEAGLDLEASGTLFRSPTMLFRGIELYEYEVPATLEGMTIPYYHHFAPANIGSITVDDAGGQTGNILVAIQEDGSFSPADIVVKPGANIMWFPEVRGSGASDVAEVPKHRVISGLAPEDGEGEAASVSQVEEIEIGTIWVADWGEGVQ